MTDIKITPSPYGTWEYIPAGGMALTAEQVEDVRRLLDELASERDECDTWDLYERLRALFPATKPAEDAPCAICNVNETNHAGVSYYHAFTTELGPFDDEGNDRPAPAEPAEEPCTGNLWCEAPLHAEGCYATHRIPPGRLAPAEPAEEETKAEEPAGTVCDETQKAYDEAVSLSYWLAKQLGEHVDEAYDRGETLTDTVQRLIEHIRPNLGKTKTASSPVVPAPTETGPWHDITKAPKHLTLRDRDGDTWTYVGDNWVTPETAILTVERINKRYAPFVAAKEG